MIAPNQPALCPSRPSHLSHLSHLSRPFSVAGASPDCVRATASRDPNRRLSTRPYHVYNKPLWNRSATTR